MLALVYLVCVLFNIYFWLIAIRILLQNQRADYYNPLSQLVIKLTQAPLAVLYKLLPYRKGIDIAALVFAFLIILLKTAVLFLLLNLYLHPINLLLFTLFDFIRQCLNLYFYLLIIVCLASWFVRTSVNPVLHECIKMVNPILKPFRRVIPSIAGFDFSPLIVFIIIVFLKLLLSNVAIGF